MYFIIYYQYRKTDVPLNIFVETVIDFSQDSVMNRRKFWKEQHIVTVKVTVD